FLQFLGQTFMGTVFGGAVSANGGALIASVGQLEHMPVEAAAAALNAWGTACWMAVLPVAAVALVCAFFLKPKDVPQKQD
ncbi:MAG: hypothetical protein LBG81_09320, partial [Coriobacteriaceae bacterium]|nr:hypothetical protein [Coriobacteriaceae bacterium]